MKIKKVAVLGAGAVGSYVIWGLSNNKEIELGVIAIGERRERLKRKGCIINGVKYTPKVWTPKEAKGADLLVVALKYGNLPGALEDINTVVEENTIVMSLMNGVDSEEIIAQKINKPNILYSFIKVASHKEDGFHFNPETTIGIILGELEAPYNEYTYHMIKALEEKNDGMFNYDGDKDKVTWSK